MSRKRKFEETQAEQTYSTLLDRIRHNDPTLIELSLTKAVVSRDVLEALKLNTTITKVELIKCNIGDAEAEILAKVLMVNPRITHLNLTADPYGTRIKGAGGIALAKALEVNDTLVELNLCNNYLKAKGGIALAKALGVNRGLVSLNLNANIISMDAIESMMKSLEMNNKLTYLDLTQNSISSDSEEDESLIGNMLKINKTLKGLNLSSNYINDKMCTSIADALKGNKKLAVLDLSQNDIGNEGAVALAEMLKENNTLYRLELYGNKIQAQGVEILTEAVKHNYTIITLSLKEGDQEEEDYDHDENRDQSVFGLTLRNERNLEKVAETLFMCDSEIISGDWEPINYKSYKRVLKDYQKHNKDLLKEKIIDLSAREGIHLNLDSYLTRLFNFVDLDIAKNYFKYASVSKSGNFVKELPTVLMSAMLSFLGKNSLCLKENGREGAMEEFGMMEEVFVSNSIFPTSSQVKFIDLINGYLSNIQWRFKQTTPSVQGLEEGSDGYYHSSSSSSSSLSSLPLLGYPSEDAEMQD